MKKLLMAVLVMAALSVSALCSAFDLSGGYDSNQGFMTLQQSGDRLTGRYGNDNGELTGLLFGQIFEGFWIEDGSAQRCSSPKNGRYYWGRVTLEFSATGFNGRWGYCDAVPSQGWNGTRKGGGAVTFTPPPAQHDPFSISTEPLSIEGVWNSSEGVITFRQQGNRVAGRYPNDNGEIVGVINNDTFTGFWIEDGSAQRCTTPKNGRYYWGRLELRFSGDRFSGKYGHCEGELKSPWSGERR